MAVEKYAHKGFLEVATKRFRFRAYGDAFLFLERNPWLVEWFVFAYLIFMFRRPLNKLCNWGIEHLPHKKLVK